MFRGIGSEEFEPLEEQRDRELTLGPAMLVALACALLLLCGICFAVGYMAGRRSPVTMVAPGTQPVPGQPMPASSLSKPPAAGMIPVAPAEPAMADLPPTTPINGGSAANPLTSYGSDTGNTSAPSSQPLVHPALPPQSYASQPAAPAGGVVHAQQIAPGTPALMVQIAAVSHPEDANVLMAALRRHGYNVAARREPSDGMIHVQIGPFYNREEATAMCQKLLGDGYNAEIVP